MAEKIKHPNGLKVLFFTEMWERFSYYGMRALLVLYLTSEVISGGFGMDRGAALKIYAVFLGLVYLTPIPGGLLADRYLGQRKAVFIGAFLMAIGQFFMAWSEFGDIAVREVFRNNGLGLIIVGTGFFKANISTIVGKLYEENDPRKDSGFTIFYMGINIGAFGGPLLAGFLGQSIGWFWGFFSAGLGMIVSVLWFYLQRKKLAFAGMPPGREIKPGDSFYSLNNKDRLDIFLYVLLNVILVWGILALWSVIGAQIQSLIKWAVVIIGTGIIGYAVMKNTKGKLAWSKMSVIFILAIFNIIFWSGYEQAGGTFNLFAEELTNRQLLDFTFPASWLQAVPALFIVLFAIVFASLWIKLNKIGKEPRTPVKFAYGLLLMSCGFFVISQAAKFAGDENLVSPIWLIGTFLMHTLGELCLSPIGLSMITKLAPQKIVSIMMGLWFASIAAGGYLAGVLEKILHEYLPNMHLFVFLTLTTLVGGLILLLISPILNKMMKGIH